MGRGTARENFTPTTPQDYAILAHICLIKAASHILLVGKLLLEAKEKLAPGEWLQMFRDHPQSVARPLPFGARTAQMLMKVAAHPILSDANHGSALPTSWRTLYELTKIPAAALERAFADGRIHPNLERQAVAPLNDHPPVAIWTEAATPAARDFERLRAEVLARPAFARRWTELQALERKETALRRTLDQVRAHAQSARHRLTEDLQQTIEAEQGPIQFRSVVVAGPQKGRERLRGVGDIAFAILPAPGTALGRTDEPVAGQPVLAATA